MPIPHDQLFKELLTAFLGDFLEIVVPRLAPRLDPSRGRPVATERFTDVGRGSHRRLDLLIEVPVRTPVDPTGATATSESVLVHVEIEARARRGIPERMWDYSRQLALREKHEVLPIVLTLRGGPAGVRRHTVERKALDETISSFNFFSLGLSGMPSDELLARPQPLAWAFAALGRRPRSWSRAEQKIRCLRPIARAIHLDDARRFLLTNCVETYLNLEDEDALEYETMLDVEANEEVSEMRGTWAGRMMEEGIEAGRTRGMREIVLRQLQERFGELSTSTRRAVDALDSDRRLEEIATRLLTAGSLEELGLA